MFASDHPGRPNYKTALARLAKAASRLEEAQVEGSADLVLADQEFQAALAEYIEARAQLTELGSRSYDGVPAPLVWLGPPVAIATRPSAVDGERGPEAG